MATNNMLHNASAYLKKLFLICGIKPHLICRMTLYFILFYHFLQAINMIFEVRDLLDFGIWNTINRYICQNT